MLFACPQGTWSTSLLPRIAPTAHDNEGSTETNPDFDHLLRGTVHDPSTRRMGGVAGHAGVFSTAHDVSLFAQALLDKILHNTGPFPLKQLTLWRMMTMPEQPGRRTNDISDSNAAQDKAKETRSGNAYDPLLAPELSRNFVAKSARFWVGHRYSVLQAAWGRVPYWQLWPHRLHGYFVVDGSGLQHLCHSACECDPSAWESAPISNLRGEVATVAARALLIGTEIKSEIQEPDFYTGGLPERNAWTR